jgi:hypothetical protein
MAYFTRTYEHRRLGYPAERNDVPLIVLHDDCMPPELFEIRQHSAGDFSHQVYPWCWDRSYGFVRCYACGMPMEDAESIRHEIDYATKALDSEFLRGCQGLRDVPAVHAKLLKLREQLADCGREHTIALDASKRLPTL